MVKKISLKANIIEIKHLNFMNWVLASIFTYTFISYIIILFFKMGSIISRKYKGPTISNVESRLELASVTPFCCHDERHYIAGAPSWGCSSFLYGSEGRRGEVRWGNPNFHLKHNFIAWYLLLWQIVYFSPTKNKWDLGSNY